MIGLKKAVKIISDLQRGIAVKLIMIFTLLITCLLFSMGYTFRKRIE